MDDVTVAVPGKPARRGRRKMCRIVMALCAALILTIVVCSCAVAVVVVAVINGFGSAFAGLFNGLFDGLAMFFMAIPLCLLVLFPLLTELVMLLATGQVIPFVTRLAHLLSY